MKILQADDHPLFRMVIQQILCPLDDDIAFLEACSADNAIEILSKNQDVDLVLLDLIMPGMEELVGLHTIRKKYPKIPIAIISGCEDLDDMEAVMEAGARGYILKKSSKEIVLSAVRLILAGGFYRPEELFILQEQKRLAKELTKELTPRQQEVLDLLGDGHCNKEIARRLTLGEGTVKQHIARIFKFLQVHKRTEAVIKIRKLKRLD